jgi:hypothetical protein
VLDVRHDVGEGGARLNGPVPGLDEPVRAARSRWSARAAAIASRSRWSHSVTAAETKRGTNVAMATPPLPGSASSTSAGTLRGWSVTARAPEWVNSTGRVVTARAWCIVAGATCERSTIMPMRFISATTPRPNSDNPSWRGVSVAESAQLLFRLWVRVR